MQAQIHLPFSESNGSLTGYDVGRHDKAVRQPDAHPRRSREMQGHLYLSHHRGMLARSAEKTVSNRPLLHRYAHSCISRQAEHQKCLLYAYSNLH